MGEKGEGVKEVVGECEAARVSDEWTKEGTERGKRRGRGKEEGVKQDSSREKETD